MTNSYSRPRRGPLGRLDSLNCPSSTKKDFAAALSWIWGQKGDERERRAGREGWCDSFTCPLQDSQFGDSLGGWGGCVCVCEIHPIYNLESY